MRELLTAHLTHEETSVVALARAKMFMVCVAYTCSLSKTHTRTHNSTRPQEDHRSLMFLVDRMATTFEQRKLEMQTMRKMGALLRERRTKASVELDEVCVGCVRPQHLRHTLHARTQHTLHARAQHTGQNAARAF